MNLLASFFSCNSTLHFSCKSAHIDVNLSKEPLRTQFSLGINPRRLTAMIHLGGADPSVFAGFRAWETMKSEHSSRSNARWGFDPPSIHGVGHISGDSIRVWLVGALISTKRNMAIFNKSKIRQQLTVTRRLQVCPGLPSFAWFSSVSVSILRPALNQICFPPPKKAEI